MSRDLTPKEIFLIDKFEMNSQLRNAQFNFVNHETGEKIPLFNREYKEQFPECTFLINHFDNFVNENKDNEQLMPVLEKVEQFIKKLEDAIENDTNFQADSNNEFESTLQDWFKGESHFMYNANDERMVFDQIRIQMQEMEGYKVYGFTVDCDTVFFSTNMPTEELADALNFDRSIKDFADVSQKISSFGYDTREMKEISCDYTLTGENRYFEFEDISKFEDMMY